MIDLARVAAMVPGDCLVEDVVGNRQISVYLRMQARGGRACYEVGLYHRQIGGLYSGGAFLPTRAMRLVQKYRRK